MMPYTAVLQVIVEPTTEDEIPYTVPYPYMPTDLGELQRSWIQLKNEWDTYREQFHEQERKVLKLTLPNTAKDMKISPVTPRVLKSANLLKWIRAI